MPRNKVSNFEMNIRKRIAGNMREMLKQRGMSQVQLADKAGIKPSTLSGYFREISTPNIGAIQKIADVLNVEKSYIDPRCKSQFSPSDLVEVSGTNTTNVPVVGSIACGIPIIAEENIESYMPMLTSELPNGTNFYLRCQGDSMEPIIHNGSLVLIHEQPEVENDEIAAVLINGEGTLKRVKMSGKQIILMPENNKYSPIILKEDNENKIVGKAIQVVSQL